MSPDDLDTMARTVWGEARGEPLEGKIAVAWVIRNRAEDRNRRWPGRWGHGIAGRGVRHDIAGRGVRHDIAGRGVRHDIAGRGVRHDIAGVCRQPWQFSCWNADDPNRAKLIGVTARDEMFRDCLMAVAAVLSGNVPDPTGGANHYHAKTLSPNWAAGAVPTLRLRNHAFYKL